MFDITSSQEFLRKLEADYADFKAQPDSARHALNCIMTAYHLHEWVWGDWLKTDYKAWRKIGGISKKIDSFRARIAELWIGFKTLEELTNGTKHFIRGTIKTEHVEGYGNGPYGVGPFGRPYLLIDHGSGHVPRWQTAEQLIDGALTFWRGFFDSYFSA